MNKLDSVKIAQKLVSVGRFSGDEKDTADVVCDIMKELGYSEINIMDCGTVVGCVGPKNAPVGLLFDSHIDIATITEGWSFDPFCAEVKDGKLLGRGSTDMKGGLAASLYAVSEYAKSHNLKKRIAVSASVMEEVMEGLGIEEVMKQYKPESVVICEPSELAVMVGQKGRIEIMLTMNGKSAHASNPEEGINSMLLAADALKSLQTLAPPVDDLLGAGILVPTDIITEPYPSISAIPEKTKIRFDRRTLPGETEEEVLKNITDHLRKDGVTDFSIEAVKSDFTTYSGKTYERTISLPPWSLDKNSLLFQAMYQGAASAMPNKEPTVSVWKCCTNGSQSAGRQGIATIGMGPGSIKQAHTIDEFIEVEQIENVSKIYICFMDKYFA